LNSTVQTLYYTSCTLVLEPVLFILFSGIRQFSKLQQMVHSAINYGKNTGRI